MDPEPGDWAVVRYPGGDQAIERLQRLTGATPAAARWVHAIYLVEPGIIVEAAPGGARRVPLTYPPGHLCWSTGKIPKTLANRTGSAAAAESYAAERIPYSWADYAAIALHAWHIPAPHLRGYIASSRRLICSQLVDKAEEAGGTRLFTDGRWNGYVRPCDLAVLIGAG